MRALVTGATGFAGQWLSRDLLAAGWQVHGAAAHGVDSDVLSSAEHGAVRWTTCDLRDPAAVPALLDEAKPDAIFHLAGISFVPAAADDPVTAFEVNVNVAVRLLDQVRRRRAAGTLDPAIVLIGSAEQYGRHAADEMPLSEHAEQRPTTVYAATKAAQEIAGLQEYRAYGVRVVMTRSFNHSGPGQIGEFLLPATVRRVLALKRAGSRELRVGNLSAVRDFLHVTDAVAAYRALAEKGAAGEVYNVCSGQGHSVADITALTLQRAGVEAELVTDASLLRPVDIPSLVGNPARIRAATGWAPRRALPDILDDLLNAATH